MTRQSTVSHRAVQCSLVLIPVRLDQTPGEVNWLSGCSIDTTGSSVILKVDRTDRLPGQHLMLGASLSGQSRKYQTLAIRSQRHVNGKLRIEASQIADPEEDILLEQNLAPRMDPAKMQFQQVCDDEVLIQWESLGVLRKYLVDRVLVCPDCNSLPTWRYACQNCGSARYSQDRLIHHFACAHVDHAEEFQSEQNGLCCPKCKATRLIAGTDFQVVAGPLNCFDCDDTGGQPALSCMCHQCVQRFDPNEAPELELFGYHVDRLELLDLLAASE